tara:strand:+ start:139342 stop:139839 length:498 start_codon:yes stop_codon:yes gene_type:complete
MKNILLIAVVATLTGCFSTPTTNPNVLTYEESQSIRAVYRGVVISIDQTSVNIKASKNATGVGAILGGLAGSQIGKGQGAYVGAGLGVLGGAVAGDAISSKTEMAFIYTVELQDGGIVTVTQGGNLINMGTKVLVREFAGGRKTVVADQSQNMQFERTNDTQYKD